MNSGIGSRRTGECWKLADWCIGNTLDLELGHNVKLHTVQGVEDCPCTLISNPALIHSECDMKH
ncbi:hypothetical protein D3P04_19310 [Paracoccus onubensis]|uniref:Uncharacterized protein n=1 Tax=Paracoccus onubensis TaxID=1675788 RepID=A0A418SNN5_9RHOB|nr:hypothetical protein D3P04_19310 [Paracoccus onubensis]